MAKQNVVKYGVVVTTRIPFEKAKRIDELAVQQDVTRAKFLTHLVLRGLDAYEKESNEQTG